jgi:ABC-type multidrug transport system fused ATPase/permease subunit
MRGTLPVVLKVLARLRPHRALFGAAVLQVLAIGSSSSRSRGRSRSCSTTCSHARRRATRRSTPWRRRCCWRSRAARSSAIYALLGTLTVSSNYTTISIGQRMVNDFRGDLYAHLQRLSMAFHSRREVGDLLFRLTADTLAIQTLTMNGFFPILTSVVLLGGMTVVMLQMDAAMTAVALAIVPVLFFAIVALSARINALASDARVKESALWAVAQRTIGAIRVIQAFTTEQAEYRRFLGTSTASLDANLRLYTFQSVYSAFVNVLIAAGTAAVSGSARRARSAARSPPATC